MCLTGKVWPTSRDAKQLPQQSPQVRQVRVQPDRTSESSDEEYLFTLGHVNKINCFSSFCLQKFGEGGGYLLFIFRGQRSYATIFTGIVKGKTGTTQVKKE